MKSNRAAAAAGELGSTVVDDLKTSVGVAPAPNLGGAALNIPAAVHAHIDLNGATASLSMWIDAYQLGRRAVDADEVRVLLTGAASPKDNGVYVVRSDGSHQRPGEGPYATRADLEKLVAPIDVADTAWISFQRILAAANREIESRLLGGHHQTLTVQRKITTSQEADQLFGAGTELALRCRDSLARWGGAINVMAPVHAPYTYKATETSPAPGMECSFGEIPFHCYSITATDEETMISSRGRGDALDVFEKLRLLFETCEPHELVVPTLGVVRARLVQFTTSDSRALRDVIDIQLRFVEDVPEESVLGPTMRAEGASSDLAQGEQDRAGAPPAADCGPSFILGPSKAVAAMIADGWKILDEPAS